MTGLQFWVTFLTLAVIACIVLTVIYIIKTDDYMKLIDESVTLSKSDLGKTLVVKPGKDITITLPRGSEDWHGSITIENLSDITNTLVVNQNAYITIVEYNDATTIYTDTFALDGQVHVHGLARGSVDLNNYNAKLQFVGGVISILVKALIVDGQTF